MKYMHFIYRNKSLSYVIINERTQGFQVDEGIINALLDNVWYNHISSRKYFKLIKDENVNIY